MNFFNKSLSIAVGIIASSFAMSSAANAAKFIHYDFLPFDGAESIAKEFRDNEYRSHYFSDAWGTTYGEGQAIFFTPDSDKPTTARTGDPYEILVRAREGTGKSGVGQVRYTRAGLAVKSNSLLGADESAGVVDGQNPGRESLIFSLQRKVRLVGATFRRADSDDEFSLNVINPGEETFSLRNLDVPSNDDYFDFLSIADEQDLVGRRFRFWATDPSDNWTLTGLKVETVPEPTAIVGLMAVGALGTVTLRRKQTT
jgi:hypothetical protein